MRCHSSREKRALRETDLCKGTSLTKILNTYHAYKGLTSISSSFAAKGIRGHRSKNVRCICMLMYVVKPLGSKYFKVSL